MHRKPLSTAKALALVAVAIALHAVASMLGGPLGPANASGDTQKAAPPAAARSPAGNGTKTNRSMGAGDGCIEAPSLAWFGAVRELPACFNYDMHDRDDPEDWNRDGLVDYVKPVFGGDVATAGQAAPAFCIATVSSLQWDGAALVLTRRCVGESQAMSDFAVARYPGQTVQSYNYGWRDIDGDGDLDLIAFLQPEGSPKGAGSWIWLENIGFEASAPIVGDLNLDGSVNSADITILLNAWTG